jgi:hypothetical protein
MAYGIQHNDREWLPAAQASRLPEMVWTYETTSAAFTRTVLQYRVFRAWNHANQHGFKLRGILRGGSALTAEEVERFNLWIQSGAAMAASNMDHFAACKLFEKVRQG